jgi:Legionella pneumophila major outer membrane protein precursor
MRLWTILGLFTLCGSVSAFFCDGCWDVGVDALYLKPVHCPITYAQGEHENGVEVLRDYLAKADYDWGFRIKADYSSCDFSGTLAYSYLDTSDDASVNRISGDGLEILGQDSSLDFAKSALGFRWQQVDLKGYHLIHNNCGCRCSLTGLIRWADVKMKHFAWGVDDPEGDNIRRSINQSSCFDGVGLGAGVTGDYCLPCNLRVGGHLDIAALIGDRKVGKLSNINYNDEDKAVRLADSSTAVVPNIEFAVYLNYTRQVCCRLWTLELGYELHYFFEALRFATAHDSGDDVPVINCHDAGFAGPYLGLSLSF